MNLLDRLLGHDLATTRELLTLCLPLTDAALDRPFDIGWVTLRATLKHMIYNIEVWTDLMMQRSIRDLDAQDSIPQLITRLEQSYREFADFAHSIETEGRLEDLWTDVLDQPPTQKSFGGAIAHVITHNMHHRAEVLHFLKRLGIEDLPEGDLMGWDQRRRTSSAIV
ncbi:MAG TPA: DinB family protein [Candidatus Limnocylindrales bacterium]|nr:DinB family protein [Candidatus Limnocylindrales bacterium]